MNIRKAKREDVKDLLEIYNYEVANTTVTFDCEEKSLAQWEQWFDRHNVGNHPLIVAEEEGRAVGYASLSPYRFWDAYRETVELSIYVHRNFRGRGIAKALLGEILEMAKAMEDVHTVISVITSGNGASAHLHEMFGFTYSGTLYETGKKFGKWLSIDNYQLLV